MASALETFRAQQEAANGIYERLREVSALLGQLRTQAELLARNEELERLLEREESWLVQAQRTVVEVRHWREREAQRFWPAVARRWAVALMFAWASAAAAGAGYAFVAKPYDAELASIRSKAEFADLVERRVVAMTPAERRQFDALMRVNTAPRAAQRVPRYHRARGHGETRELAALRRLHCLLDGCRDQTRFADAQPSSFGRSPPNLASRTSSPRPPESEPMRRRSAQLRAVCSLASPHLRQDTVQRNRLRNARIAQSGRTALSRFPHRLRTSRRRRTRSR